MRRANVIRVILMAIGGGSLAFFVGARELSQACKITLLEKIYIWFLVISIAIFISVIAQFLIENRIYKGLRYFYNYFLIKHRLTRQLIDSNFVIQRNSYIDIPKIGISLSNKYMTGEIHIENRIKDLVKLQNRDISCALGKYIVEQSYISKDSNYTTYEIFNAHYDRQLKFANCNEFIKKCKEIGDYELMIDGITTTSLHHSLISGVTGSGKSYAVETLIAEMLNKRIKYNLYFADPKQSGISVIGKAIDESKTADNVDTIIDLLRSFHSELIERKKTMEQLVMTSNKVDSDYRDFGLSPCIFIFDEYLAFSLSLNTYKKEVRDEVSKILSDIVLMGRALGVFLWLVMQSAPSTQIPTFIRDQLVFKCVLGNSDDSTYTVVFGAGADVPIMKMPIGYGVFTYAGLVEKPKLLAFPTIRNFDILTAIRESKCRNDKLSPLCNNGDRT